MNNREGLHFTASELDWIIQGLRLKRSRSRLEKRKQQKSLDASVEAIKNLEFNIANDFGGNILRDLWADMKRRCEHDIRKSENEIHRLRCEINNITFLIEKIKEQNK